MPLLPHNFCKRCLVPTVDLPSSLTLNAARARYEDHAAPVPSPCRQDRARHPSWRALHAVLLKGDTKTKTRECPSAAHQKRFRRHAVLHLARAFAASPDGKLRICGGWDEAAYWEDRKRRVIAEQRVMTCRDRVGSWGDRGSLRGHGNPRCGCFDHRRTPDARAARGGFRSRGADGLVNGCFPAN